LPLPSGNEQNATQETTDPGVPQVENRAEWIDAGVNSAQRGVLQLGLAQGSVDFPGAAAEVNAQGVFQNHLTATQLLASDIDARRNAGDPLGVELDLVLWPENALSWDPRVWPTVAQNLDDAARATGSPLLIGAMEYPESGGRYNVMLLWEQGIGVTSRYAKQRPAPFGEYIPLRSFARLLTDQVDRLPVDMLPGNNPPIIEFESERLGRTVKLGVAICFEVLYDQIFFDAARRGAEVMLVPTNNASFGLTAQSHQQLQMAQMQAIATGRAAVQLSTVGVSGVIAPDGSIVADTSHWILDRMSALVPLRTTLTPATVLGMWPHYVSQALALLLPGVGIGASIIGRRRNEPISNLED
jgi:apolipoprotein N-acyltransferase